MSATASKAGACSSRSPIRSSDRRRLRVVRRSFHLFHRRQPVNRPSAYVFPLLIALYYPFCTAKVRPTMPPSGAPVAELWQQPNDIASRDVFYGPWGVERAPAPDATYTFVERKQQGTNPGVTVKDPLGREWHVKQPPHND